MTGERVDPPGAGDEAPVAMTPAQRHLAELAGEGRERQAAALAAEKAEERRIERRVRRDVERFGRATIRATLLDSPRGAAPPRLLGIATGAMVAGTGVMMIAEGVWSTMGLALILLASGGFFAARGVVARRLVGVERRWLSGLPFPVRGYFRVLGDTPEEERQVRLRIRFRDAAPEREVLEGLLGRITVPATARLTGGAGLEWKVESGPIRTVFVDDVTPTNAAPLWWMRSVINEALIPLHEAYPLRTVSFSG